MSTEFSPIDEDALLLGIYSFSKDKQCVYACHSNYICRIFDYDFNSYQCRLFQGDLETTGSIIISNSSTSLVGQIKLNSEIFSAYGSSCNACFNNRYLICINSICDCPQYTYWTGSMCASQNLRGGQCSNSSQCRTDLNHTCLQFFQCGPASLLNSKIIFGNLNGSSGNSNSSLNAPWGIRVNVDNSILIADYFNKRVLLVYQNSSIGIIVASKGSQIISPSKAIYDANVSSSLYVLDTNSRSMVLFSKDPTGGQSLFGSPGSSLSQLNVPASFYLDSNKSFYIADQNNHRIVLWLCNASSGSIIAGVTNVSGNDIFHLNKPTDVFVDEESQQIYVADYGNHRIVRYTLGSLNGTVVAGGNGPGTKNYQLNNPISVCVSKKTGALYIADQANNRIQKWIVGDSQGVTVAGSPDGINGTSDLLLSAPNSVALNSDETYLFVADRNNHQIKMFELI